MVPQIERQRRGHRSRRPELLHNVTPSPCPQNTAHRSVMFGRPLTRTRQHASPTTLLEEDRRAGTGTGSRVGSWGLARVWGRGQGAAARGTTGVGVDVQGRGVGTGTFPPWCAPITFAPSHTTPNLFIPKRASTYSAALSLNSTTVAGPPQKPQRGKRPSPSNWLAVPDVPDLSAPFSTRPVSCVVRHCHQTPDGSRVARGSSPRSPCPGSEPEAPSRHPRPISGTMPRVW